MLQQILKISNDRAGQRLDNFLLHVWKKVPKSHVYKLLRKGAVRVNKKRAKPDYRLQDGDELILPLVFQDEGSAKVGKPSSATGDFLQKRILYEDKGLLVLNKPSGMASHGGSGINFGVIETLRLTRDEPTLELVHRLDRDTSGCLIIAKKHSVLRALHELIRAHKIEKKYLLLVRGVWQGGTKKIALALKKNELKSGERMVKVDEAGQEALTIFKPIQVFSDCSLLEAELKTGRTHQIRVHAAASGFPLAGDEKYGDRAFNKQMKNKGLHRLFLHARTIAFQLPTATERLLLDAPLDDELALLLKSLT